MTFRELFGSAIVVSVWLTLPNPAGAATWYVAPISTSCNPASTGAGTLSNPWTNLFYALTHNTFAPGDVIQLRGGTYQNTYNGWSSNCNFGGEPAGVNTILPIPFAGNSGSPITIQNYPGEVVILDGTNARPAVWTAQGGNCYTTTSYVFGSTNNPQLWANPSGPSDAGTRLRWGSGGCGNLSAGQFYYSGSTLSLIMPDSGNPANETLKIAAQQGDSAYHDIAALSSSVQYVTVQRNALGGGFYTKYSYYCLYADGGTSNLKFSGVNFVGCGGRDYGNAVRVYNGNYILVENSLVSDTMAEGVGFYGGGPGCSTGNGCGIQTHHNTLRMSEVRNTGWAYIDGGGLNSNLGMGVIIKNCDFCTVFGNNIHHNVSVGVHVTTAQDANITSNNTVIDSNTIHDFGYECTNGCGERNGAGIQVVPQNSCTGGCTRNTLIQNNYIHNSEFTGNTHSEHPYGITLDNGNQTDFTGTVIVNNSLSNIVNACLDLYYNRAVATIRNNAMTNCSTGTVGSPTWGSHTVLAADSSTAHVHSNNTYWSGSSTDTVINRNGSTVTRGNVTAGYEASAVQASPAFSSATNLSLTSGSPMIGAGTPTQAPLLDIAGKTRPNPPSIGANEFATGATPPSQPTNLRLIIGG